MVAAYLIVGVLAGTVAAVLWLVLVGGLWGALGVYTAAGMGAILLLVILRLALTSDRGDDDG